ncbi:MAG: hypothetical protein HYX53_10745 [Chloroflexi bacterium]|nr:hypothetical protein [Chloroflexota bacterium]
MMRGLVATLCLWGIGALLLRVAVVPPGRCPAITSGEALASAEASAAWIARVQNPDGSYLYEYNRNSGLESPAYNVVRHAGVTMSLYQFAALDRSSEALATAERATAWMEANLYRSGDWAALRDPLDGSIEVGGSALMLSALAQRRIAMANSAPDVARYDALMREIGRFLLAMQQPDGSFLLAWDVNTNAPDPVQRSKYATGEAFWALALMQRLFPGEGWDVPTQKVADYLSLYRDAYENQKYPPWADQWAAYGLAEMAAWPVAPGAGPVLNDANIRYARSLAERFGFLVRTESQRRDTWFSDAIRGREARAAGMGTWSEALDSLWRLASLDPRLADMRAKLAERASCAAGMLRDRQLTPEKAQGQPRADVLEGAWFAKGVTRMDDQQHALSGLLRASDILAGSPR